MPDQPGPSVVARDMMPCCALARRRCNPTPAPPHPPPSQEGTACRSAHYAASAMNATVWLVIPTYNEADNLDKLVRAAGAELDEAAPGDHRILIVDDNSPDGTGAIADALISDCD